MAFPATPLPVEVRIAPGGDPSDPLSWEWQDITDRVRAESGITIGRGRGNEYGQAPPADMDLTLIDPDGRFVPRNPTGEWFGRLRRNTPIQVRMTGTDIGTPASDTFTRSVTDGWGTATSGQVWSAASSAADLDVGGTSATIAVPGSNTFRAAVLGVVWQDVDMRVTFTLPAVPAGGRLEPGLVLRWQDSSNHMLVRADINTDSSIALAVHSIADGVDAEVTAVTVPGLTFAASTAITLRARVVGAVVEGRAWLTAGAEPSTWHVRAVEPTHVGTGAVGVRSGTGFGNTNTNPQRIFTYDNFSATPSSTEATMYIADWPVTRDLAQARKLVSVSAASTHRRLQQGTAPLRSAMYRALRANAGLVAAWSFEEARPPTAESGAVGLQSVAETRGGQPILISSGLNWASDDDLPGSAALPEVNGLISIIGRVPPYEPSTLWTIEWVMRIPASPSGVLILQQWETYGTVGSWQLIIDPASGPDTIKLRGYNPATGAELLSDVGVGFTAGASGNEPYGQWVMFRVTAQQHGADIDYAYYFNPMVEDDTFYSGPKTVAAQTIGNVYQVSGFGSVFGTAVAEGVAFGHVAVTTSDFSTAPAAALGHWGETAYDRYTRLCQEEGIAYAAHPAGGRERMGVQGRTSLPALLRECEAAAGGMLVDSRGGLLRLVSHEELHNQTPAMQLGFNDIRVLVPTDDDQQLRNEVTASRPGGSSRVYRDEASIAAEGLYDDQVTVSTATDERLAQHAAWQVGAGTVEEMRYPRAEVELRRTPALITSWVGMEPGREVTISGLPSDLPPDLVEATVQGFTQELTTYGWYLRLNLTPARIHRVVDLEADNNASRADTSGSQLLVAVDTDDTTFAVECTTAAGVPWDPNLASDPFDLEVLDYGMPGERCTATAAAWRTPSFVGAGAAATANNAGVSPALHASTAAGDLVLVFATIRSSGTGVPDTPTGYERLAAFPAAANCQLFAKVAGAGESAPLITFSGSAAGDDTIAQAATFRNASTMVHAAQAQLNASAANIAYPALSIRRDRMLVLYLGWKQDDWTSVATVSGATEIGEPDATAGNDAGLVWDYLIQTTAANIASGSFVVTGGASAISRGAVVALRADQQTLTVTRSVNAVTTSHLAGAGIRLWRPHRWGL